MYLAWHPHVTYTDIYAYSLDPLPYIYIYITSYPRLTHIYNMQPHTPALNTYIHNLDSQSHTSSTLRCTYMYVYSLDLRLPSSPLGTHRKPRK